MKYAVIALAGTQFKIKEDDVISVNKLDLETGNEGVTDQVLLVVDGDDVKVGTPTVTGASVKFELVKHYQGEKIEVETFKAKSRYRRHIGFRAQLSEIKITKITA
jgi:large subunit ribosomal protein L21